MTLLCWCMLHGCYSWLCLRNTHPNLLVEVRKYTNERNRAWTPCRKHRLFFAPTVVRTIYKCKNRRTLTNADVIAHLHSSTHFQYTPLCKHMRMTLVCRYTLHRYGSCGCLINIRQHLLKNMRTRQKYLKNIDMKHTLSSWLTLTDRMPSHFIPSAARRFRIFRYPFVGGKVNKTVL